MPAFQYKAIDNKTGKMIKNTVNGVTKQELYKMLKNNGLTPIDIQTIFVGMSNKKIIKKHRSSEEILRDLSSDQAGLIYNNEYIAQNADNKKESSKRNSKNRECKITTRDIIIFTKNFLLLKKANFNNKHALETVINSTENARFESILEDILAGVESREYMYTTMEYYADIFPVIYVNMIKAGELTDSLEKSLEQAIEYLEKSNMLEKKIKKIIFSNVIQILGIIILLIIGTIFIIPVIQRIVEQNEAIVELPWLTRNFLEALNNLKYWWYYPAIIIVIVIVTIIAYIRTPKGKYQWNLFKYKVPIFGQLMYTIDFLKVMKVISINLQNGMKIQQALEASKKVVKNNVMISILEISINNCLKGKSWIEPFEKSKFVNEISVEMLKTGMQTDLTKIMDKLIEFIESDIDTILQKITKELSKVSYILVGVALIFFICVVLVPCIQVYMSGIMFSSSYM